MSALPEETPGTGKFLRRPRIDHLSLNSGTEQEESSRDQSTRIECTQETQIRIQEGENPRYVRGKGRSAEARR